MFTLSIIASYGDHGGEGSFGSPLLWQWQHSCLLSQGQSVLLGDVDLQVRCEISISSGASDLDLELYKDLVASLTSLSHRVQAGHAEKVSWGEASTSHCPRCFPKTTLSTEAGHFS